MREMSRQGKCVLRLEDPAHHAYPGGGTGSSGSPRGLDILAESRVFIFQGESSSESSGWLHFKGELEAFRAKI